MNKEYFDGKVMVITGASSGMGAALAKYFALQGTKIAMLDLDEDKGKQVEKDIREAKGTAAFYKIDVTDKKAVQDVAENVENEYGAITHWINSAGISKMKPFLDCEEALWDLTINVNLKATFLCCQVAVEMMLKHGEGVIMNMSSLCGKKASAWQTIYCASKFGVQGLTQSIAKEFADRNIRVNSLCPGIVQTEMWEKLKYEYAQKRNITPEEVMPYFKKNIPMHRLVDIQDVLYAAEFLLSDHSGYLTGQSINLVGGEWMD